jgi:hypothetical protein
VIYRTPGLNAQNAFVRGVFADWETSVIATMNSGRMERVECCANYTGTQTNRPDLVGDPKGPETVDRWFNVNAFAPPAVVGQLGKSPRAQLRGPGINNWDLSFMKNFPGIPWFTDEKAELQFRAEFYNSFNHTQFMLVDTGFSIANTRIDAVGNVTSYEMTNPNFGRVTRIREPREIQLALKLRW